MDVYLFAIPEYRESLPQAADRDLEPLVRLLQEKKETEHRELTRSLRSSRFRQLMENWKSFIEGPEQTGEPGPNAGRPIAAVASEAIWHAFEDVMRKGEAIEPGTSADALHRLRIRCKKLRYLLTFFQTLFPKKELGFITRELKLLQAHLGRFNDLHVQQLALRTFAEELMETRKGPPATLLAMGQLLGRLEEAQKTEREAFHQHFREFARPENQERFRSLFGPHPEENPS
jgi:CHAD domain-containing protein